MVATDLTAPAATPRAHSRAPRAPADDDGGRWAWGQRMLARIRELQAIAQFMADRAGADPDAAQLQRGAERHLELAARAVTSHRRSFDVSGTSVDRSLSNYHVAACLVLRYAPLADVTAMLPQLDAEVAAHLAPRDVRRIRMDQLLRGVDDPAWRLTDEQRGGVVATMRATYLEQEREQARVRSFRNIVWAMTACLTLVAIAVGVAGAISPRSIPLCFAPEDKVICPTGEQALPTGGDLDDAFADLARAGDYAALEGVGLVAAAIAAAASLRQIKGTSTPYGVPVALAALKLPTGALTAVLGLLLMRGQFVPGLSALDTSAQIVAWAIVFGYAQQLLTRFVDERGQAVLNAVTGPDDEETFRTEKLLTRSPSR